jgi:anti-sigma B factor antagonist
MRRSSSTPDAGADRRIPLAADTPTQRGAVPEFETRTERLADSRYVVSVAGEIDLFTGPPFRAAVFAALDAGAGTLIVDLSECSFMDSTGISILVGANERLNHSAKPLAVVTDDPNVHKVLQITGVDTMFGLYPSRSAAINGDAGD